MKQELLERLKPYKHMLITAYKTNCVHGLSMGTTNELFNIAAELDIHTGQTTCPACVLKCCRLLGKALLEDEEKKAQEDAKKQDIENIKDEKTIHQDEQKPLKKAIKTKKAKK